MQPLRPTHQLVGNFRNGGTEYCPKGEPRRVKVHDFEDKTLGKVVPYGVYDVAADEGWVSVGITADTAAFAVHSIRLWRERMGRRRYPQARELTITADCGGSNGVRVRLWKVELQKLADETGLTLHVHHYPPGTSKWNKIEHRLFCRITQNWRGRPLTDRLSVVELIAATTTKTGLKVACALDERTYQKGVKVSDVDMDSLNITGDEFPPGVELHHQAPPVDELVAVIVRDVLSSAFRVEVTRLEGVSAGPHSVRSFGFCHRRGLPAERIAMRQVREVLRLNAAGVSGNEFATTPEQHDRLKPDGWEMAPLAVHRQRLVTHHGFLGTDNPFVLPIRW